LELAENLYKRQVTRILTTNFPKLFAVVTRIHRETKTVGVDGGIISYSANKQIQAKFQPSSVIKSIRIGLQVNLILCSCLQLKMFCNSYLLAFVIVITAVLYSTPSR